MPIPILWVTNLKKVVYMATNAISDILRLKERPTSCRGKVVRKDQLRYWRSLRNWVVCLKIVTCESLFHMNLSHRQILQRHMAPNQNSGKKGSIAKYYPKKSAPLERSLCAPELKERSHEETLHQWRCARKAVWDMAQTFKSSRIRTKLRLTFSLKSKGCQHLPLQRDQKSENLVWIQHGCSYEWGQRSRATTDPKNGETYFLQDRQFRTSCRSRLICQFWKQFVFCNATTGIVGTRCTLRLWKQGCIECIFGFGIGVKWLAPRRAVQDSLSDDKKDVKDPLADLPFLVRGFHR